MPEFAPGALAMLLLLPFSVAVPVRLVTGALLTAFALLGFCVLACLIRDAIAVPVRQVVYANILFAACSICLTASFSASEAALRS